MPITIRDDAPEELRYHVLNIAHDVGGLSPSILRGIICSILRKRPDRSNWSDFPNIWGEVQDLTERCEWYFVYDIVEAIYSYLEDHNQRSTHDFEAAINALYYDLGIGWQLVKGLHETRGDSAFESTMATARAQLPRELVTTTAELNEAIRDLSRRPDPDLSGAVQHAMAALEAVARKASGDRNKTLGDLAKRDTGLFPPPLHECVAKAWGFASENARHGMEGRDLSFDEAQFIVGLASILCAYVSAKCGNNLQQ